MLKTCSRCSEKRPVEQFGHHKATRDGLDSWCSPCRAKAARDRYAKSPEIHRTRKREQRRQSDYDRLYQREYRAKHPEQCRETNRKWRAENRDKIATYDATQKGSVKQVARQSVRYAIQAGKVVRPDACERCHEDKPLHAHHENYYRPLDVTWLCHDCHGLRHREINEEIRNGADYRARGFE